MRGLFFQVGLITACGLTFVAFEWTTSRTIPQLAINTVVAEEEWDMPVIVPEEIVEKPMVKAEEVFTQPNPDKIEIVPDKKEIKEDKKKEPKKTPEFKEDEWKEVEPVEPEEKIFRVVEDKPEFIGSLGKYLGRNLKFPEKAKRLGDSGKVYVEFMVNKKGEVKNVKILRGVNKYLDAEAVRVIKAMPNWKPGKQRGKPVNVYYMLPINFTLK